MRALAEIRADILALESENEGLLDDLLAREPRAAYGKLRVYADTSVIGGCEDDEFREPSRRLFADFREGRAALVVSELTQRELARAPRQVQDVLRDISADDTETLRISAEAKELADAYLAAGALNPLHRSDALHIALATLAGVDVLASWNFKHMVNWRRISVYNEVNRRLGYPALDIRTPEELTDED